MVLCLMETCSAVHNFHVVILYGLLLLTSKGAPLANTDMYYVHYP
jgi:hypothetical protein